MNCFKQSKLFSYLELLALSPKLIEKTRISSKFELSLFPGGTRPALTLTRWTESITKISRY